MADPEYPNTRERGAEMVESLLGEGCLVCRYGRFSAKNRLYPSYRMACARKVWNGWVRRDQSLRAARGDSAWLRAVEGCTAFAPGEPHAE